MLSNFRYTWRIENMGKERNFKLLYGSFFPIHKRMSYLYGNKKPANKLIPMTFNAIQPGGFRYIINNVLQKKVLWLSCIVFLIVSCKKDKDAEYVIPNDHKEISKTFVGSATCAQCHQKEYEAWEGSHHDLAMKIADSTTVLGNFNNIEFTHNGVVTRFFKKGKRYFVNTQGPDGEYHDYKVIYTFGVEPLQQYLVKFPKGHYQALLTAWDSKLNKWYPLQEQLDIQHTEWLHWSGGAMRWNTMCADCHSTNLQKNFDPVSEKYHTTFSEINVSCEACHGPAGSHVEYYQQADPATPPPALYMQSDMSSKELVEKCARCHSRRSQLTKNFDYEGHFLDHYEPELLHYPVYERDGQIKDEDYVYASFKQSRMYREGVSCIDCHDVHSTRTVASGNDLCLKCHETRYDQYSHHFHEPGTEASLCINCHMTGQTYMGNDFRRDHSFRIPRPDQTVLYDTPNACNSCHQDKDAQWASEAIIQNYGKDRSEHFSDHLIPGQLGDFDALKKLISHAEYPEIVRATAVRSFTAKQFTLRDYDFLRKYATDSSALVRNEVLKAMENFSQPSVHRYIEELLNDSIRLIRINAARHFVMDPSLKISNPKQFAKAQQEYLDYLEANADFPSGQHQIALYHEAKGETEKAAVAYKKAIKWDDHFNPARMNLALLEYTRENTEAAEKLYEKVISQEPNYTEAYYMLGLLYYETGRMNKALNLLEQACNHPTPLLRACYNYALMLQETGDHGRSIDILNEALKAFPEDENLLYVKLIGELRIDREQAIHTINKLLKIAPDNQRYLQIKKSLVSE